jgi:pentatricopeptide repeat protein
MSNDNQTSASRYEASSESMVSRNPIRSPLTPTLMRRKISEAVDPEEVTVIKQRLVEYFVVVSSQSQWRDHSPNSTSAKLQQNSIEGNIHMPQQNHSDQSFCPRITARYPEVDYIDNPLNPMITQFCYPHSESIIPSETYIMPKIHYFVLTNDRGRKVYGTCLTVYEEYSPSESDPYSRRHSVHSSNTDSIEIVFDQSCGKVLYIPRVLCILSAWPYLLAFREYLSQLYRFATTTSLMEAPIERYIQNLCVEIPAPPPGAFEIEVKLFQSHIRFWAPPAKLPVVYVSLPYEILFECLDLENIMHVWYALLSEQKVLLLSSQYSILTVCAEVLISLLFPLRWSHIYVPLLPRFLSPMLEAPIPYLVGVIRENWNIAEQSLSPETIVVDLDCNHVTMRKTSQDRALPPNKTWNKLRQSLEDNVGDVFWRTRGLAKEYDLSRKGGITEGELRRFLKKKSDIGWKEKLSGFDDAFSMAFAPDSPNLMNVDTGSGQSRWEKVQEAFLRFFVSSFKSYRKFLHIPSETVTEGKIVNEIISWDKKERSFDRDSFVAWQKHESQAFFNALSLTQHFDDFITKCLYSPGEPDIMFFNQSIDSKLNKSKLRVKKVDTPLLLNAKAHKVLKTIRAVEPSHEGLKPNKVYRYSIWPERFDNTLFGTPRLIPSIITAEFDRQASLVERLRVTHKTSLQTTLSSFPTSLRFNPSPETATFSVFFFVYCSLVNLDWYTNVTKDTPTRISQSKEFFENMNRNSTSDVIIKSESESHHEHAKSLKEEEKKSEESISQDVLCESNGIPNLILHVSNLSLTHCNPCSKTNADGETFHASWQSDCEVSHPQPPRCTSLLDGDDDTIEFEANEIVSAQLEIAFEVLSLMISKKLQIDPDAFKSVMDACARCGSTENAIKLIQLMKQEGYVPDSEIYSCFLNSFVHVEPITSRSSQIPTKSSASIIQNVNSIPTVLKNKMFHVSSLHGRSSPDDLSLQSLNGESEASAIWSDSSLSEATAKVDVSILTDIYNVVFSHPPVTQKKNKAKKRINKKVLKKAPRFQSDILNIQAALGESLLTFHYPKLLIDMDCNSCPLCSALVTEEYVVAGWKPCDYQDYTTQCPQCKHRFIPHFTVRCSASSFLGSQGKKTPLYCELFSPWVLRNELEIAICSMGGDVKGILDPKWRSGTDIRASLWWNLIVHLNRCGLPMAFLFQWMT